MPFLVVKEITEPNLVELRIKRVCCVEIQILLIYVQGDNPHKVMLRAQVCTQTRLRYGNLQIRISLVHFATAHKLVLIFSISFESIIIKHKDIFFSCNLWCINKPARNRNCAKKNIQYSLACNFTFGKRTFSLTVKSLPRHH